VSRRPNAATVLLAVVAGSVGCGGASKSVPASGLASSLRATLITKFHVPASVTVDCGRASVHAGQVLKCTAVAGAGRGYRVAVKFPCWLATFNGDVIEGPGFQPPGTGRPPKHASVPDNLPDSFSGCVR
jgi:hypothetical protein